METSLIFIVVAIAVVLIGVLAVLLIQQSKSNDKYHRKSESDPNQAMGKGIAIGLPLGFGPGIAMGIAMDNIALGIAIGSSIGISIGVALGAAFKKKAEERRKGVKNEFNNEMQAKRMPVIAGLILAFLGFLMVGLIFYLKSKN